MKNILNLDKKKVDIDLFYKLCRSRRIIIFAMLDIANVWGCMYILYIYFICIVNVYHTFRVFNLMSLGYRV